MNNEADPLNGLFRKSPLLFQLLASWLVCAAKPEMLYPNIARRRAVATQARKDAITARIIV